MKELSALVEHKTTSTTFAVKNLEKLYNLNASQALVKANALNENNGEYSTGLGHGKVCLFLFLYFIIGPLISYCTPFGFIQAAIKD